MATTKQASGRYADLLPHAADNERERLQSLAEALDEGTIGVLRALRPRPDWRCLEIGAGVGTVAAWLARECPAGEVTATDLTLRHLGKAAGPNLHTIEHDITTGDFPAGSFDLICSRYVFIHQAEREQILARVATWLAPGGWLVLEDPAEFPVDSSPHPAFRAAVHGIYGVLAEHAGTAPGWARTFPEPLAKLGLERVGARFSMPVVGPGTPMARFIAGTLRALGPAITAAGLAVQE
jgi:SAM-dependent methyltransferase